MSTPFKIPVQLPFALSSQCVRRIVVLDVIAMDAAFGACALAVSRCHVVPIARYAYQFALQLLVFFKGNRLFSDAVSCQHVVQNQNAPE